MDMMCMRCEQEIPEGIPYWSVTVQNEVVDGDEIEVREAVCYLVFCDACAEQKDFSRLAVPEKSPA